MALAIITVTTAFAFKAGLLGVALPLFIIISGWNMGLQLYNEAIFESINRYQQAPQHIEKPKERLTIVSVQKK